MEKICSSCKMSFISILRGKHSKVYFKRCENCRQKEKINREKRQNQEKVIITDKYCRICKKTLPVSQFYKHRLILDGYRNECKECHSQWWKNYYNNGYNEVLKVKLNENDIYRRTQNLKSIIHYHLKSAGKVKSKKTLKYVGCNKQKLERWFNYQNNHWYYKIYHIDHILPISLFDLSKPEEEEIALHWTNLQPLFGSENNSKYNKIRPIEYYNKLIQSFRFELSKNDIEILQKRHIWFKNYCNTSKLRETP